MQLSMERKVTLSVTNGVQEHEVIPHLHIISQLHNYVLALHSPDIALKIIFLILQ